MWSFVVLFLSCVWDLFLFVHCKTTSLVTWLVNPFGLVSILLSQ